LWWCELLPNWDWGTVVDCPLPVRCAQPTRSAGEVVVITDERHGEDVQLKKTKPYRAKTNYQFYLS
jgi:hypothetical protein